MKLPFGKIAYKDFKPKEAYKDISEKD